MNVVSGVDSHASFISQNLEFASSFQDTQEPANLPRVVSANGSGWFSLLKYSFSLLRSTQTLTFPFLFWFTAMGAHQSLGWSTLDMTPVSNILSSSSLLFWYKGKGTFLGTDTWKGQYNTDLLHHWHYNKSTFVTVLPILTLQYLQYSTYSTYNTVQCFTLFTRQHITDLLSQEKQSSWSFVPIFINNTFVPIVQWDIQYWELSLQEGLEHKKGIL